MGKGSSNSLSWIPNFTLIVIFLLCFILHYASPCGIDQCWVEYNNIRDRMGQQMLNSELPKDISANQPQCVTLRTYMKCVKSKQRGCHGDIRYNSVKIGIRNQMKQFSCNHTGSVHVVPKGIPMKPPPSSLCAYHGRKVYRHCGLFGDPHLRTFNNEFQTCRVKGAWPLINNEHLTVQVTNDMVTSTGGATATSKLTVVIKQNEDCVKNTFRMYQAQTDYLPGYFYDGQTWYGEHKSVELVERDPGKHVEIYIKYIDTTISVRQIGRYFTFAINMPEDVLNSTKESDPLELCTYGCPATERIDHQEFLSTQRTKYMNLDKSKISMSKLKAEKICREAKVVKFYFDSCVFDLMTTGDKNFTLAANKALQDVLRLTPNSGDILDNVPSYHTTGVHDSQQETDYNSARTPCDHLYVVWLISLLTVLLRRQLHVL